MLFKIIKKCLGIFGAYIFISIILIIAMLSCGMNVSSARVLKGSDNVNNQAYELYTNSDCFEVHNPEIMSGLETGDLVWVSYSMFMYATYPECTEVYNVIRISDGEYDDIPKDVLERRFNLGQGKVEISTKDVIIKSIIFIPQMLIMITLRKPFVGIMTIAVLIGSYILMRRLHRKRSQTQSKINE